MNFIDKKHYWEKDEQLKLYWIYFTGYTGYTRQERKVKKGQKRQRKELKKNFLQRTKKHIKCKLKKPEVTLVQMIFLFKN